MICITISDYGAENCKRALRRCERYRKRFPDLVAELRLDLCGLKKKEISDVILSSKIPLIVTSRKKGSAEYMEALLSGADYIDVNIFAFKRFDPKEKELVKGRKSKLILSFHDYTGTPDTEQLTAIYKEAVEAGADIVKIVTTADTALQAERVISLYSLHHRGMLGKRVPLVAFSMGEDLGYTRIEAHDMGSPFLYCVLNKRHRPAPGMFPVKELIEILDRRSEVSGEVKLPASKSIAQRAIVASILAKGESEFHNFSHCHDIDSAVAIARQLTSGVHVKGDTLYVSGGDIFKRDRVENSQIDLLAPLPLMGGDTTVFVGESGLLSRLCMPIVCLIEEPVTVTGEGSLMERKMYGCKEAMEELGATCFLTAEETLPAVISGTIRGGEITLSGKKGSQFISGLLMTLPMCKKSSVLTVENPTSIPYLMLTVDVIKAFGVEVSYRSEKGRLIFDIPGKQKYKPAEMTFEADWSAAANFVVAAAIFGDVLIKGLNMKSLQADRKIIDVVRTSGAFVESTAKGVKVRRGHLRAFEVDVTNCPDLLPPLSILAAFSEGISRISGVARLNNKESDRPLIMTHILKKMGVAAEIDESGDILIITGKSYMHRMADENLLKGGSFSASSDHRVAMALKIMALGSSGKVNIDDVDCIRKSFPDFLNVFGSTIVSK